MLLKGGTANYRLNLSNYDKQPAYKSTLTFKTTSFFDKIYKMRDTLSSYINPSTLSPIYSYRVVDEGNTHFKEHLYIKKHNETFAEVNVKREKGDEITIDTTLISNNLSYDFPSIFVFIRSLDYSQMKVGDSVNLTILLGKKNANVIVRYDGQSVIKKSETIKYNTFKLTVDIANEVFNESKNAIEIWLSSDQNKIPIKVKAKLKIGVAEANLVKHKNLKYPLAAEIKVPSHKTH